mmetsp:Transcript_27989/g.43511  ORF Transcript_27989/g.43511 Transcript_27989/m.43511 type:complete len:228 (-) Transcript_27989:145-828(-)
MNPRNIFQSSLIFLFLKVVVVNSLSVPKTPQVQQKNAFDRRQFIKTSIAFGALLPFTASADDTDFVDDESIIYASEGKGFGYLFRPPDGFKKGNKPLKTHLDEINFGKEGERGYTFGITVDPVRIESLKGFGTPAEVAARVVAAEVVRDGVFDVTLVKDATEEGDTGYYAIDYVSSGKRGVKHFVTRIYILNQMLYVLTAQCKEEEFKDREKEMLEAVRSFKVTGAN